jgi:tRNA (guanine37-N1)-methyltransferase
VSQKKWCVSVPKQDGERLRQELKQLGLLNGRYRIEERMGRLFIPFKGMPNDPRYEVEACAVRLRPQAGRASVEISYDVIGDIAIINWFEGVRVAAAELLEAQKNIKVVLASAGGVNGKYRLKKLLFVAGEKRTETIHKEYGSRLLIDVSNVYFSPRLATERHRVAQLAQPDETVVDMFAGVGPYTIMLAKKIKKAIAFELNPIAFRYLKKNIDLNKLHNVLACLGNAKNLAPKFEATAERVIMNLPHSACNFLDAAVTLISGDGGVIHFYDVRAQEHFPESVERVRKAVQSGGRILETIRLKRVRSYAPGRYHICVDTKIAPK